MNALRLEADESAAKNEELKAKVKSLEQENLAKEQEITSLAHKNQLLEGELEKIESGLKDAKAAADESAQHGTQNESLQRRLQLLEEEAEEADRNLRETNDKYVYTCPIQLEQLADMPFTGFARPTSRPATTSARCKPWRPPAINGRPSTRRWPPSTMPPRRSSTTLSPRLATSKPRLLFNTFASVRHGLFSYLPSSSSSPFLHLGFSAWASSSLRRE